MSPAWDMLPACFESQKQSGDAFQLIAIDFDTSDCTASRGLSTLKRLNSLISKATLLVLVEWYDRTM